jgi:signal transduction histidine kinase
VRVELAVAGGAARLTVSDDGRGFDPAAVPEGHFGLIGMGERARLLGGELRIDSSPGHGTTVEVSAPL